MTADTPLLAAADLAATVRKLPLPFDLRLVVATAAPELAERAPAGKTVTVRCRQILRLLPGRRLVTLAEIDGRPLVMKLFIGRGSRRYRARESRGCDLLRSAGVATPVLLGEVEGEGIRGGLHGLLFEYLVDARPVGASDDAAVTAAAAALARLHGAGCRHRDLHLDNFLVVPGEDRVFVIDGDGVRRLGRTPNERRSLEDLALLCAQRPPLCDAHLPEVLEAYARHRHWAGGASDERLPGLGAATRRQRRRRVGRYLEKAQRDCTAFLQRRSWRSWLVAVRQEWGEGLAQFAADPEAALRGARVLKAGNSATVVRVRFGGRQWVVKRYNVKSTWHALRRSLVPTPRSRLAWLNGQRLHFLDIPTARPAMLLEQRLGPLRLGAYLVMEDLGDQDLAREIAASGLSNARLLDVTRLFSALEAAELRHGDTKASNFLVTPAGVHLVDLDALRVGSGRNKDIDRFLANFDHLPEIRERFAGALRAPPQGRRLPSREASV